MTEPAAIGPLVPGEADAAVALWQAAGLTRPWNDPHADIVAALACPSSTILATRDGNGLAGTVMAGFDGHRGLLYYLAVAEHAQGRGLGRALVSAAEAWLAGQGAPAVRLMLRRHNPAGGFYAGLGYAESDVVVLGKPLS